ncbi:MAG: rod shape-determining protein RodA, partial [Proteobacteria bacterium]
MLIDRRLIPQFDLGLFMISVIIPLTGLTVLYSAGYDPSYDGFSLSWLDMTIRSQAFLKQIVFLALGLVAMAVAISISPSTLGKYSYLLYGACVLALLAVDIFGAVIKGSQRWLDLGGFNIQPAEPTKLALILTLARYLSRNPPRHEYYTLREILIPLGIIGFPFLLILIQPDLGTSMMVLSVGSAMLLFVGIRIKTLLILILPILVGLYPAWNMLHDYQRRRIEVLINPEIDPKGSGYHITQSKIAVGSGAVFGKGYMQGTQTQLEFLPEHTTDFIFSVLAEEWGFIGCIFILALYMILLYRILRVVQRSRDLFNALV